MSKNNLMDSPSKKPVILVVDDEIINFEYINMVFMHRSYNLIHARDGFEAIELCRKDPTIKLVIMDLCMPGMDGYTATMKIHEFLPELPIIAVTATWQETLPQALESGCIEAFDKPITKERLLALADRYLQGIDS